MRKPYWIRLIYEHPNGVPHYSRYETMEGAKLAVEDIFKKKRCGFPSLQGLRRAVIEQHPVEWVRGGAKTPR